MLATKLFAKEQKGMDNLRQAVAYFGMLRG